MSGAKIGLSVAVGYLLGRTKKARLAITVGSMLAGQEVPTNPRDIMSRLTEAADHNPEIARLRDRVSGELLQAVRAAAIAMATSRIESANRALSAAGEGQEQAGDLVKGVVSQGDADQEDEYDEDESGQQGESDQQGESAEQDEEEPEDGDEGEEREQPAPAARRQAPRSNAPQKSAAQKSAPQKSAQKSSGTQKSAQKSGGTQKSAPQKSAQKSAPQKSAQKSTQKSTASRKSAATRRAPATKKVPAKKAPAKKATAKQGSRR